MGESTRSAGAESAAVAASIDGAGVLEGETFVTANEELAASFGYDGPEALAGTSWRDLYPQAERERLEGEVLPRIRDGRGWRGEVNGVRSDGATFRQVLSIQPADDDRLIWVVRDLAGRGDRDPAQRRPSGPPPAPARGTEGLAPARRSGDGADSDGSGPRDRPRLETIGELGFRFRLLAEAAPVPVVAITGDRGIVYSNTEAVDLLGADGRADVLGRAPEWFVHPDDRDQAGARLHRVIEEGEATEPTDYRLIGLDGEERFGEIAAAPVTYDGEPAAYVVINDVTAYRRSQARLRRERRFLETVIDAVDDVVYVLDESGEPDRWNQTLVETTGYSHEEIAGMHNKEFLPEDQHQYAPGIMEAIDSIDDRRVELDLLTKDGERIPHEFRGTTFEDPGTGEVFRCGVARDVSDRLERERRLERYETIVETVDDGVYALDEDLRFSFVNAGLCEMLGLSREEVLGTPVRDLFAVAEEFDVADEIRRRVETDDTTTGTVRGTYRTRDGERIFESRYRLHPDPDGEFRGSVGVLRDVTDREERRRELERQRDELTTLDRINRTLLETTRELIRTADREVIERTVCSQLVASDLYGFVWTGERALDGDGIVPRSTAGEDRGILDALRQGADGDAVALAVAERAIRTGTVQVHTGTGRESGSVPDLPGEGGYGSIAAVPLHREGTGYGVLVIHTERPNAFSTRERDGFDVLGRTIGFIVNAIRSRKLLFTDAVVELEFRLPGADSVLEAVARDLDCELVLSEHVVEDRRWVLYVDVEGAPVEDVVDAARDGAGVERARVLDASQGAGRVELVVRSPSVLQTIVDAGAAVQRAVVDPDEVGVVAEVSDDADVREFVGDVRSAYPAAELVAQRDRDREVTTGRRPEGALGVLTDRQEEVLEAAYRAGYYAWPRKSTAAEIAESLDLASSTLHGHLRKAEATILSSVFDDV